MLVSVFKVTCDLSSLLYSEGLYLFWHNLRSQLWVIDQVLQRVAAAEFIQQTGQVADYCWRVGGVDVARDVPNLYQGHVPISIEPMGGADLHTETFQPFLQSQQNNDGVGYCLSECQVLECWCCLPPGWYHRPPGCWGWCWTEPLWGRCCCWWSLGTERRCAGCLGPNLRRYSRSRAPDRNWSSRWWFGPRSKRWRPARLDKGQQRGRETMHSMSKSVTESSEFKCCQIVGWNFDIIAFYEMAALFFC